MLFKKKKQVKTKKTKKMSMIDKFIDKIHKAPWTCPVPECGKKHKKLHYAYPDQINHKKKPLEEGRVKYGREEGKGMDNCDVAKNDDIEFNKHNMIETGPSIDKDGNPAALFCPHCGWEEEIIIIVKTR